MAEGTPGQALLVTGKFLSELMIQADGQLFGSAWQIAPQDFLVLNCPLVLHCNLANEKSKTYVTLVCVGCCCAWHGPRPSLEAHPLSKVVEKVRVRQDKGWETPMENASA